MKRFLAIFMLSFYALFAVGINVHMHYCNGKLKDVSILSELTLCCEEEADGTCSFHMNCCENKAFRLALEDEHQPSINKIGNEQHPFVVYTPAPSAPEINLIESGTDIQVRAGPPGKHVPVWIMFCRLTTYG